MSLSSRIFAPTLYGTLAALISAALLIEPSALAQPVKSPSAIHPLAGVVRSGSRPVAGARLMLRSISGGFDSVRRILKTSADGTFVWPDVHPGLYTILSVVPGFRPAEVRVLHRADQRVAFITLQLEPASGVLPPESSGAPSDPWVARAVASGDILRELGDLLAREEEPPAHLATARNEAGAKIPLRASVESMTGFGSEGSANLSRTTLDVSGSLGESFRWGLEGQYRRLASPNRTEGGDASRVSLDLASGFDQSIRVSSRRQVLPANESDPSRFSAQAVDWSGSTGDRSHASVSARLVSESNLLQKGPAGDLFSHSSNELNVQARYRTESAAGHFVRFTVGYRSLSGPDLSPVGTRPERETRVGGTAGIALFPSVTVEGGATGDFSLRARGVTPELTVTVRTEEGWRVYGFVSRRFERRLYEELAPGIAGTDEADLSRLSRSAYRGGIRYESHSGETFSVEGSQREMGGTYRLLFDPEFLDHLDSVYFLEGDVATQFSASTTFHVTEGLDGRISARAGRIRGERASVIQKDSATFETSEAAVRLLPTGTSIGIGYREVSQELFRGETELRNDLQSVDFTLAQNLPIPILRALGSEWRALFSLEFGRRREGEDEERSNRRFSGGLSLSF